MNASRSMFLGLVFMAIGCPAWGALPNVVFDSLTGKAFSTGGWGFGYHETGQIITLEGTLRTITQFDVAVTNFHPPPFDVLMDFRVRFYELDGTTGLPDTKLWESQLVQAFIKARVPSVLGVTVPGVYVPTTFAWTLEEFPSSPLSSGIPGIRTPPSIGTIGEIVSVSHDGSWIFEGVQRRGARVYAIPEPATWIIVAVAAWLVPRRRSMAQRL